MKNASILHLTFQNWNEWRDALKVSSVSGFAQVLEEALQACFVV